MSVILKVRSVFKTWILFILTLVTLFFIVLCYPVVKIGKKLWLQVLQVCYPKYEFSKAHTIRTAVDTVRNPGITHYVIKIDDECDIECVKQQFKHHILDKRLPNGKLAFPRIQCSLNLCWGNYVWTDKSNEFDLSNHIFWSSNLYRGRTISESNIQAHLSDTISKYLPQNLPPWQMILTQIVKQNEISTYILIRLHHLVMAEQPNLRISDFLLVDTFSNRKGSGQVNRNSPFNNVVPELKCIPDLQSRIVCNITNKWNEFKYNISNENTDDKANDPLILIKLLTITTVNVVTKFIKNFSAIDNGYCVEYLKNVIVKELESNNLDLSVFMSPFEIITKLFNPIRIFKFIGNVFRKSLSWIFFYYPKFLALELWSLVLYLYNGQIDNGLLTFYIPLIWNCFKEVLLYIKLMINGPRQIWEQVFNDKEHHALQMATICGRKVIGWSEKIKLSEIIKLSEGICTEKENIQTEIILTWLAASIKDCLQDHEVEIPDAIELSSRCIDQHCLLGRMKRLDGLDGIFCLSLPLGNGDKKHLVEIMKHLEIARKKNITLYSLTKNESRQGIITEMTSTPWVRLMTNYLSKKFCITVSDTVGHRENVKFRTLYGKEISEFLYVRPPIANTSISITIQRYDDHVRLGVVADAELSPNHQKIIANWPNYAKMFIKE